MALTITVPELAQAVRVQTSATAPVVEPYLTLLTRLRSVAEDAVEGYAIAAPNDVKMTRRRFVLSVTCTTGPRH